MIHACVYTVNAREYVLLNLEGSMCQSTHNNSLMVTL